MTDKRHTKYLEKLTSVASKLPPVKASRVAACIVYKGRVVSVGVNSKRTDTFQKRFSKNEHAIYLHAEIAAIKAAKKHLSLDDPEPEEGQQFEFGIKVESLDGKIITSVSAYELERKNIPLTLSNGFTQQSGDQRSRREGYTSRLRALDR